MLCILATPKQMNSFWKICKNFNEIERSLIIRNPKRHRITSILFITTVFCIYTIFYLLDLLTWHANYEKIDCAYTLLKDFIPFYVLKYIMLTEILFFCHLVYFTSFRIVYLVESLKKIIKERIFDVSGFENGEIKVLPPTMTYNMKINDTALRVYQLATVHKKLVETIEIINGTGGFVIVIILFSVMIHLVVSPYFLVSELEKGRNSSMIFVSLQCMWIIAHAGKFFIVMETCNHCGSKSEELFIVVQKLFVQEKVVKTKTALLNLIIQLKLCKTQINILGLFKLDRSLLTGVSNIFFKCKN
ncbi:unnamed protein product [Psylliodes chrysocephalus]|uniref:Gustatory receptor n=1 Tax=Psylliodes chrysocephalus TaxID=3402493 RepID=A0A9P0CK98_9CUCU|nr:unnamed protein product [Psylliodes chrysocephala]